jgi:hypothetical protein
MFDRFRQKYPQGSITSSLIQIHNDQYIVSVSIKVDGVVLATTLAADEQIQVAEAQATAQAIQTLYLSEPELTELPLAEPPKSEVVPSIPDIKLDKIAETAAPIIFDENVSDSAAIVSEFSENSKPEPKFAQSKKEKMAIVQEDDETTTYNISTISPAEPSLSVTDMIPLINMELKRLGWSRERGRDCIIELYNKRSSSLLSDEELLGLLRYLQTQPATEDN